MAIMATARQATQLSAKLRQGVSLHRQGRLAQAQLIFEEILAEHPSHVDTLHLLALVAGQAGNSARALQLLDAAVHVDPTNAAAHSDRGVALKELKQWDAALASYDRAIAL